MQTAGQAPGRDGHAGARRALLRPAGAQGAGRARAGRARARRRRPASRLKTRGFHHVERPLAGTLTIGGSEKRDIVVNSVVFLDAVR